MNRRIDSSLYRSSAKQASTSSNQALAYLKYTRALKTQPNDHTTLHKIFAILYHQQKFKLAEAKIRKVLIINPNNPRAYFNRGVVLDVLEKYKESERAYCQCIKYDKKMRYASSFRNLAAALMKQGRYKEALKFGEKAIRLMSHDGIAYNVLGRIHFLQGKYDKAIENYEKGIELAPNEWIIYLNKAIALWLLEKKEEAEFTLEMMKRVMEKAGKRNFKEEVEACLKEMGRLGEKNEEFEQTKGGATFIEGIQLILSYMETELGAPKL